MKQTRTRAVLFDMDGVLVDSYEAWFQLMKAAARDFGYPALSRRRFHETWGQGPDLDVELLFTNHTVSQMEAYYDDHFQDHSEHLRTNPSAKKAFEILRDLGLRIAVITNTPSSIAREVLTRADLGPDALVGGTDVPRGKPAPEMVYKALDLLQLDVQDAVFVGDSGFDRQAADASGIRFIHYDIKSGKELDKLLTFIL